jgi:small subunit ribosomal protein S9
MTQPKVSTSLKIPNTVTEKTRPKQAKVKADKSSISSYGTGRRKNAVARVWVKVGSGAITVNKKLVSKYFPREAHVKNIIQPFIATKTLGQYDVVCTVKGGGSSGQAGAILHGVARALDKLVPDYHKILRDGNFLTRDSREVERKKYGKRKARKSTQFSKR